MHYSRKNIDYKHECKCIVNICMRSSQALLLHPLKKTIYFYLVQALHLDVVKSTDTIV